MSEDGERLDTDGDQDQEIIEVCPHCDSSSLQANSGGGFFAREGPTKGKYRCSTCDRHFDEPNTRPKSDSGGNRRGLAGRLSEASADDVSAGNLVTDGGAVEHPGLEAVAAEEYDGNQECDYGCGSVAEYCVELQLEGSATTSLVCNGCSKKHKLWVEENGLLENVVGVDPLAKIAGQTEVEITCAIALDAPRACDGWTGTVELDDPARYVNSGLKLPGFDWECPECGNPSEFEVDGTRVSKHV